MGAMTCGRSMTSCIKVTLCLLNIWVLCVVLVVALGHWRIFDTDLSFTRSFDDAHLVVMRELKEEGSPKQGPVSTPNKTVVTTATKSKSVVAAAAVPASPKQSPTQKEIADRVDTMRQWCRRLRPHYVDPSVMPAERLSMIMVDRKHRLAFCQIPGVAQNDWRRIFIFLTGKVNASNHLQISAYDAHSKYGHLIQRLSDFPPAERKKILHESTKLVFVRDPFERLLFTYQNKFLAKYSKYFHETFGRRIIQRYRKNATAQALKSGSDVTFNEFVRFVVDNEREATGLLNEHWERYYKLCQPCAIQYDVVGKFESLVADTTEVLSRAGALKVLKPPYMADTLVNSEKVMNSFYQTVNPTDLKRLWKIYYPDYNLFSYPYPNVLKTVLRAATNDY
ncbi:carbohydrate sulfotransferase 11-like isoform X2 [Pomacea canaliculata]|uniref:carbohydrate sulfotransferase 11-like isoform X2 n=1 Tax=Pomacea canaliculata TaxID=400727 RepID=UPI000D726912|nr:carbohydrate sulfotransferase 11-like isoform X2 [Pomacea canaliculata]